LIDAEVEHDEFGLPFLRGRALKGLLAEECANILFSLGNLGKRVDWELTAQKLFGIGGSGLQADAKMHVWRCEIAGRFTQAVRYGIQENQLTADEF